MDIDLPYHYTPRDYQLPILGAIDDGFKRAVWVAHRRAGKEKTCTNLVAKKMIQRVGTYFYVFPTYNQGRKILWDGMDKEGFRFRDHFPKELVDGKPNDTEMKLRYKNSSVFQIVGSDNVDSIVGTNPVGVVFSEYSLQDPSAWGFIRPILAENDGWAIFVFTPRGENHAYDIFELARNNPQEWFSQLLTVDDTRCLPQEVLDQEKREIMRLYGNDALFQQEYYCNFTVPIAGAYYADNIMQAYKEGRIGNVPYEPGYKVDTWWDLGLNDRMSIWFTQRIGAELRVIDYEEGTGKGLNHWAVVLQEKRYVYGTHNAPHDIEVRELTSGRSRRDIARDLGIDFVVTPKLHVQDGIEDARNLFSSCWFDREKCALGLNALKNYRKQYDEKRRTYLNHPFHDWSSNAADGFRTLAVGANLRSVVKQEPKKDKYMRAMEVPSVDFNPMTV
jgi:hypothetical protein